MSEPNTPLLQVDHLSKFFAVKRTKLFEPRRQVHAVEDVSFTLYEGETLGIVGESGSGKSTLARAILALTPVTGGSVQYRGETITDFKNCDAGALRSEMQMIFQDPMACLNPRKKVSDIIAQGLDIHHICATQKERNDRISEILEQVGLAPEHASRYPHQFSGGQRQRVGIARALIMRPRLIIADECISALDVSIQAQVVNLMKDIQQKTGCAYLFIAHDLSMVKYISDRIGVLHLGHLVETGTKDEIFTNPIHPYTKSLLSAIPHPNPEAEKSRKAMSYDYRAFGVDYNKGTEHLVNGTHFVLATDGEYTEWTKDA